MIDPLETVRERTVWRAPADRARARFRASLPKEGHPLSESLELFERFIKPCGTGNGHPAFMGWVHGAGTPVGMVAEMLAAGLNANCGGRDQIALEVERQIALWMSEAFGFPDAAAGLFVTGTSIANFLALLVARNHRLGDAVRKTGLVGGPRLIAYASEAAHGCVSQSIQLAGLGSDALRLIPCDPRGALRLEPLSARLQTDRRACLSA